MGRIKKSRTSLLFLVSIAIADVAQALAVHAFFPAAVTVFPARFIVEFRTTPLTVFFAKKSHGS